jgi:hypothetical protein
VLLDDENVQSMQKQVRPLVPDARHVWVFLGPHQRDVEQRFESFGGDATAVPISKTGKNALDFHLSFYMGHIASKNPGSAMVVIANDKGYEPMLAHAQAMGFAVRWVAHGKAAPAAKKAAGGREDGASKAGGDQECRRNGAGLKAARSQEGCGDEGVSGAGSEQAPAKKAAAAKAPVQAAKKVAVKAALGSAGASAAPLQAVAQPARAAPGSAATINRWTDNLRKMATSGRPSRRRCSGR